MHPSPSRFLAAALALVTCVACADGSAGTGPPPEETPEPLIAFSYDSLGVAVQVGVMRPDGSGKRLLTSGTRNSSFPAWSPDGLHLALSHQSIPGQNARLHVMNAVGTGLRAVVNDRTGYHPSWSPDGARLLFDDNADIWEVRPDGSALRKLEGLPWLAGGPAWSPDGRMIAFTAMHSVSEGFLRRALFVMRADGTELRRVALDINGVISHASWSPDGKRLVFESDVGQAEIRNDLWVLTVANDSVARLTSTPQLETQPAWSPDGERIVFARRSGAWPQHVFTMRSDGTDVRQLTTGDAYYASPSYRPLPPAALR